MGSRGGLTPLRTCLIQCEHREQQLSEEHGLGQRPADQPWPNELTLQCLSLSICKNRAIQTFLRCLGWALGRTRSKKSWSKTCLPASGVFLCHGKRHSGCCFPSAWHLCQRLSLQAGQPGGTAAYPCMVKSAQASLSAPRSLNFGNTKGWWSECRELIRGSV